MQSSHFCPSFGRSWYCMSCFFALPLCAKAASGAARAPSSQPRIERRVALFLTIDSLPGKTRLHNAMKITVQTTVAAPIDKVWRAYTTPEDIKQWNAASDDWHTTAASVDLRAGGAFSSRMEAKDGSMGFDFAGTYTRIVPNKLIECSFGGRELLVEFLPVPGAVTV